MTKRKSISDKSPLDRMFSRDEQDGKQQPEGNKQTGQHVNIQTSAEQELKRATFYIRPEQNFTIEELRLKLRKSGVNTNKSELVRVAIDFLADQDEEEVKTLINTYTNM